MQMLTDMGYFYGYDNQKLDILKEKLSSLDSNQFLNLFRNEKSIQAILEYYPNIVLKPDEFGINPDDIREDITNLYDALIIFPIVSPKSSPTASIYISGSCSFKSLKNTPFKL